MLEATDVRDLGSQSREEAGLGMAEMSLLLGFILPLLRY